MADQKAVTMAVLVLHDSGVEITEDNINSTLAAANYKLKATYWPGLFASTLKKVSVEELLIKPVSGGGGGGGGGGGDGGGWR